MDHVPHRCHRTAVEGIGNGTGRAGGELSGGEKQRLAIARAILQDRPIETLDEATSALDARTEECVLERLALWCTERIVIVVSHRPSASVWADRVVALEKGRVVADGIWRMMPPPRSDESKQQHRQVHGEMVVRSSKIGLESREQEPT